MKMPTAPFLRSVRIRNFKAIRDSGLVKLTPLTVFIGNNGVGKSSLVEALETLQIMALDGLDDAMNRWKGIEHVTNKLARPTPDSTAPISFYLHGRLAGRAVRRGNEVHSAMLRATGETVIASDRNFGRTRVIKEWFHLHGDKKSTLKHTPNSIRSGLGTAEIFGHSIGRWQFLLMNPDAMGEPQPPTATRYGLRLTKDARNIAAYLKSLYEADQDAFNDLIEAMRFVVPYAKSFNYEQTGDLIRSDYLTLTEVNFKIPGWMISTGTLRVLAILACLRHPDPPQLLVIEELENGLDPRTLGLVLSEINGAVDAGQTQVIITTHSPSLLDQVSLESIVTVQRENGQPTFRRPADDESLAEWRNRFLPGQLYTMGRFRRSTP